MNHPDDDDILRYLQDGLSREERQSVEVHIGGCRSCATRFASLSRLCVLADQRQNDLQVDPATMDRARAIIKDRKGGWIRDFMTHPRFRLALAGSTFALLLAVYLLFPTDESRQFRSGGAVGSGTFILSPEDGAIVTNPGSPFRWTSLGSPLVYQFSLLETTGKILWRADTPDTAIALPQSVVLQLGKTYLWRVETSLADKTLKRSALHAFTYSSQ